MSEEPPVPSDRNSTLRRILESAGWKPDPQAEVGGFLVDFPPPYLPIAHAYAAIAGPPEMFLLYLNVGVYAEPDRREKVLLYLNFVNSNLYVGNFEMDYDDGLVRFRASVVLADTEHLEPLIRNALYAALSAVEKYGAALVNVIARGQDPMEAFSAAVAAE